jgi:hypothetical protein
MKIVQTMLGDVAGVGEYRSFSVVVASLVIGARGEKVPDYPRIAAPHGFVHFRLLDDAIWAR